MRNPFSKSQQILMLSVIAMIGISVAWGVLYHSIHKIHLFGHSYALIDQVEYITEARNAVERGIRQPTVIVTGTLKIGEFFHPPGQSTYLAIWYWLFGYSDAVSIASSIFALGMAALFSGLTLLRFVGPGDAILLIALFYFFPMHQAYSFTAMAECPLLMFVSMAVFFITGPPSRLKFLGFMLSMVIAATIRPTSISLLAFPVFQLIFSSRKREDILKTASTIIVAAITYKFTTAGIDHRFHLADTFGLSFEDRYMNAFYWDNNHITTSDLINRMIQFSIKQLKALPIWIINNVVNIQAYSLTWAFTLFAFNLAMTLKFRRNPILWGAALSVSGIILAIICFEGMGAYMGTRRSLIVWSISLPVLAIAIAALKSNFSKNAVRGLTIVLIAVGLFYGHSAIANIKALESHEQASVNFVEQLKLPPESTVAGPNPLLGGLLVHFPLRFAVEPYDMKTLRLLMEHYGDLSALVLKTKTLSRWQESELKEIGFYNFGTARVSGIDVVIYKKNPNN